mgnify:FL=1
MIQPLTDQPKDAVGFKVSGQVTKEDYEKVVQPALDRMVAEVGKINFLLWLDTDVRNYTPGAAMADILIGLQKFTHWNKIAIVSDQEVVQKFIVAINFPLPGDTKAFSVSNLEEAKAWVSS